MAATMSTRQLAAAQTVASIKSVPVAPIARAQTVRSNAVVDRRAIASSSSIVEVRASRQPQQLAQTVSNGIINTFR